MPNQNFNPDTNPFQGIMGGGQPMPTPQLPQQDKIPGSTQQQTAAVYGNQGGAPEEQVVKQLEEGQEGTGSKFLLGAIQNIQNYITSSTNPQKIQMMRQLVGVFTSMLASEQEEATAELQGMQQDTAVPGEAPSPSPALGV